MGGYGSGPYGRKTAKRATNGCPALDIRRLKRDHLLRPGASFTWQWTLPREETCTIGITIISNDVLKLNYRSTINDGEPLHVETRVLLDRSRCNYGGDRVWLHCPHCQRTVALLYLKGHYFRCRHCHDLTYHSCQESGNLTDETERKVNRILVKLKNKKRYGFELMYYRPLRPKGMHWDTYQKLMQEYNLEQMKYITAFKDKMDTFNKLG